MNLILLAGSIIHTGEHSVYTEMQTETLVEQTVTYTLELDGSFMVIEHVPARVNIETGERFFAPQTVERLQQTAWGQAQPKRIIQTPVFEFAMEFDDQN